MTRFLGLAAIALAVTACGDNRIACGDGTVELGGRCVAPTPIQCGGGTVLSNGVCILGDDLCQAGTVLIGDRCVDPAKGLTVDLEEAPEPNGNGVAPGVEASPASAGVIALPAPGETFVAHGHLTPFRDADLDGQLDPDVDTYELDAAAPTLLAISVDGIGGAIGAFYVTAQLSPTGGRPAQRYERYGVALAGDTARRRLFLPAAGRYQLAITDLRALAIGDNPPPVAGHGGAAGGPDAEYYVSITVEQIPAPSLITSTTFGMLGVDQVAFFTADLGSTTAKVGEALLSASNAARGAVSVTLGSDGAAPVAGYAEQGDADAVAMVELTGAGVPLIAVDAVYNTGPDPVPFVLYFTVP